MDSQIRIHAQAAVRAAEVASIPTIETAASSPCKENQGPTRAQPSPWRLRISRPIQACRQGSRARARALGPSSGEAIANFEKVAKAQAGSFAELRKKAKARIACMAPPAGPASRGASGRGPEEGKDKELVRPDSDRSKQTKALEGSSFERLHATPTRGRPGAQDEGDEGAKQFRAKSAREVVEEEAAAVEALRRKNREQEAKRKALEKQKEDAREERKRRASVSQVRASARLV